MHRIIARLKVELIVLFGYACGLVLVAGLNPQGGIFAPLETLISTNIPDEYIRITLALILIAILALSVKKAYAVGGPAAIIAVAMGFLAGLATPMDLVIGLAMLGLAVISAYISVQGWKTLQGPRV